MQAPAKPSVFILEIRGETALVRIIDQQPPVVLLQPMPMDFTELEKRCVAVLSAQDGDVAHGLEHVRRVVRNARSLAAAEGARLEIVVPAAWLHDCVTVPKDSPERARASRLAAEQAVSWLREWGWPAEFLADIAHAVEAHSFTAGIPPRTPEAKVVQDADRLEAIGAVGLARCLMLGGAMGRPLYAAEDPFCARRAPDDRASAVDHFYTKLLKLEGTMQTAGGRREARARTEFLERFLAELKREIGEEGRNLKPET
jgi:uncharacterized protein